MPTTPANNKNYTQFDISIVTILKLIGIFFIGYIFISARSFLLLLLLAILISVTLAPVLAWLVRRGLSRQVGLIVISVGVIVLFASLFLFLIPPLVTELGNLSTSLPHLQENIVQNLPTKLGIRHATEGILATPMNGEKVLDGLVSVGQAAMGGATSLLTLIVFSLYFLADGPRAYQWLLPYFSVKNQKKIGETVDEVLVVVTAYISGQLLTSIIAGILTCLVLTVLGVPAALALSVFAGIFDILPIIGFFLFIVPAGLLALTVSSTTALWVVAIYTGYHLFETYILIPKVYGSRMRLSGLIVLLGIVLGGLIGGIPGAIAILPILSSYPIIERIWLAKQVGTAAVEEHTADVAGTLAEQPHKGVENRT